MSWIAAALLAALCAGITSILAKCGMQDTDSEIATGIRTAVVLVFAWLVVDFPYRLLLKKYFLEF